MKKDQSKTIAYLALYVALYVLLKWIGDLIPFLKMPNGGSIELELIPVFIASYHLGWKGGVMVSVMSWLITIVLGFVMWFVHPIQIFLDYLGPLMACGAASVLWVFQKNGKWERLALAVIPAAGAFFGILNSYGQSNLLVVISVLAAAATFVFNYYYLKNDGLFGIVIAMFIKYALQVLSGVYYWFPEGSYAGSGAAWTFSIGYNLWYNLVTMVICIWIVPEMIRRLKMANIRFEK